MKKYIGLFIGLSLFFFFSCTPQPKKSQQEQEQTKAGIKIDSVEILTQNIRKDSGNYELYLRRAILQVDEGNIDPALRDLMQALELNRDDPRIYLVLSDIYFLLEKPQNSIDALKKALEIDRENQTAFLKLAEIYLLKAEYRTAQQYAESALRVNSENAEAYYLKAIARLELKDTTDALNNLKISARLDTMNYMTLMQIATIYDRRDDTASGLYYRKALQVRKNDERALYLLGMFYQNQGAFDKALKTYQTLANNYPEHINAIYNSGYIYLVELEDYESAAQFFQQVINMNAADVRAVYNLGRTYEAMGLYNKARIQYRQSLDLLPNYPLAVQGLNRLDKMGK